MSCYLLLSETWPKSTHVYISAVVVASDNFISLLVIPLYFYLGGKHWKQIFSVTLFLPLIAFVMIFFIPESPRYLYSRKRYTELDETMKYIAKVNKIEYNINSKEDIDLNRLSHTQSHLQISSKSFKNEPDYHEKEYSIFDDLRRPVVIFNILIILIGYTVVSYSNYLLMIYTKYIGGNIFLNNLSIGFSTLSSCISAIILKQVFQNKYNLAANILLSLIFLIPILFSPPTWIIAWCCFISSLGVFSGYPLIYVVITDLFHPLLVPLVFSICNVIGRTLTILSSQVAEMPDPIPVISAISVQVIMILSIFLIQKDKSY